MVKGDPDKTILEEIANFIIQRTQPTTVYKVRAYANITGNEEVDTLVKEGTSKKNSNTSQPHEFAHSTLYYYQRGNWLSMGTTPDKGCIRFLEKHLTKHDKNINLEMILILYPNIDKWIANEKIDNELSNKFWTNKNITDSQKTCPLELRHGQYMGNAEKQLFFGMKVFPSITCPVCNSPNLNTWLHVLLKCK